MLTTEIPAPFFCAETENLCSERDPYETKHSNVAIGTNNKHYAQNFIETKLFEMEDRLSPPYSQLLQCYEEKSLEGNRFQQGRLAVCELAASLGTLRCRKEAAHSNTRFATRSVQFDRVGKVGVSEQFEEFFEG